jgi:uncharacterized membrane protein YeaQ/YmgE (transglycosylase-associated protein family)
MFSILGWIIFGLIVGALAKLVMPGRDPGGIIVTIVLGIVGALLGGWLGRAIGLYGPNEAAGFVMALIGALILLGLYRLLGAPPFATSTREIAAVHVASAPISGWCGVQGYLRETDHQ